LALSGLGSAPLRDLEFKLDGGKSWARRLATPLGRRSSTSAWGLDFGTSGLKFVRLTRQKEVVCIDCSGLIAYPPPKPAAELTDIQPMFAAAFEQFIIENVPGDERLVINFPGTQSLGRFFTLPPVSARKRQAALEFEIANQIPLPANEIVYSAHYWRPSADKTDNMQHVAVVAAKLPQVTLRSGAFCAGNRWLQSESIALLNALLHCFNEELARLNTREAIAFVDVGESATNVVAVSPGSGPWFRTVHRGVRSLNRPIVDLLGVTWQQADRIRHEWPNSHGMPAVDCTISNAIAELTRDVERAFNAYSEAMTAQLVKIHVAGGGCDQFGLLREWSRGGPDGAATVANCGKRPMNQQIAVSL
jgi:type IV pilus assembly protein PilM